MTMPDVDVQPYPHPVADLLLSRSIGEPDRSKRISLHRPPPLYPSLQRGNAKRFYLKNDIRA